MLLCFLIKQQRHFQAMVWQSEDIFLFEDNIISEGTNEICSLHTRGAINEDYHVRLTGVDADKGVLMRPDKQMKLNPCAIWT